MVIFWKHVMPNINESDCVAVLETHNFLTLPCYRLSIIALEFDCDTANFHLHRYFQSTSNAHKKWFLFTVFVSKAILFSFYPLI